MKHRGDFGRAIDAGLLGKKVPSVKSSVENAEWTRNPKMRPSSLDEMLLYPALRKRLKRYEKSGSYGNLLLYGQPGTGKTTAARIITSFDSDDYSEFDFSGEKGVKSINAVEELVGRGSLFGGRRFILDEFHDVEIKNQKRLKKILEDTPSNRFIFCVNDLVDARGKDLVDITILDRVTDLQFDYIEVDGFGNINVLPHTGWDGVDDYMKELKKIVHIMIEKGGKVISDQQFDKVAEKPKNLISVRKFLMSLQNLVEDDLWDAENP